jgi:hypothetical protein
VIARTQSRLPWDQPFFDPINPPKGKPLITLRDAARVIPW